MNTLTKMGSEKYARILIGILLICALILPAITAPPVLAWSYPLSTADAEVTNALDYLRGQQDATGMIGSFVTSAWITMAIAAAGENPDNWKAGDNPSIVDYLSTNAATAASVADYERMILAITAASGDPTNFGGRNFVALVKAAYDGIQIGDNTMLNDDFWGIIALVSAGESPSSAIIQNSATFIKANQDPVTNGFFSNVAWGVSVDDTAAAIMALIAAGDSPNSAAVTDGFTYIKGTQDPNGGFLSWGATNADTDAWAICSIKSAGQNPTGANWTQGANTPIHDLISLQQPGGSFNWQAANPGWDVPKTTASAIVALVGKYYPVKILPPPSGPVSPKETVNYGSLAAAVQTIESLGAGEAATFLNTMGKERAGQILGALGLEKRTDLILEMDKDALKERLTELAPDKLFEISAEKLFEKLPNVPTEQLIGETPPTIPSDLPVTEKLASTFTSAGYLAPEARAGEWVSFFSGSIYPFTSLALKPNKNIENAVASIKILPTKPAGVKLPSSYPYLSQYYGISLENITAQDITTTRLTFRLKKEILDFMGHNKWSVLFNRWDTERNEWMQIPTRRIAEDARFVYYSTTTPCFSTFTITGSTALPAMGCEFSNLNISPLEAATGEEVTVTADIINTTTNSKSYTVALWLNQTIEKSIKIDVPAGEKEPVSFTTIKKTIGEYQVRIDKLMGSFTVVESTETAIETDITPPEVTSLYPNGIIRETNLSIGAQYHDDESGINATTVKLTLDGEDITPSSEISDSGITCIPTGELQQGEHTVTLSVSNTAGNESFREWTFTIKSLPLFSGQTAAVQDLNGDDLYEDVTGDGKFDIYDIALLYKYIHSELVQVNSELFDFDQNGFADYGDIRNLMVKVYKQLSL